MMHGGPQLTLSYLRRRYWILSGRSAVKRVLCRCVTCALHRALRSSQVTAPWPPFRVKQTSRPYAETVRDYAGPTRIRYSKGRGHKVYKDYNVFFIGCATRAFNLEVASHCNTDAFITASRYSFRQVKEFVRSCVMTTALTLCKLIEIYEKGWKFNSPAAPHFSKL